MSSQPPGDSPPARSTTDRPSGLDWWLAGFSLSRTLNQLVFVTYAAALPVLRVEWGMSATVAGSVLSGFHLGYGVSLILFSVLADFVGPKRLYLGSMSAGAVLALAFAALARDYFSALILHTLLGFALGGTYTTGLMILADQYSVQRRGMAVGLFIGSGSLGLALSLVLSGLTLPLGGYRLSFLVTCLGPAAGSILAWIALAKRSVRPVKRQEKFKFYGKVIGNRPARLLIGSYILHAWELLGMWAWIPAFLAGCLALRGMGGLEAAGIGSYISALLHTTGLMASFSMGLLSDRHGRARVMTALAAVSAACSFVFGWSIEWPLYVVVSLGLIYAFTGLGDSPVLSAALTEVVETPYLGAAFGLRSLLGFGAGALSPLIFGAVLDWTNPAGPALDLRGWGWAFGMLGLGGAGAAMMAHLFDRAVKKDPTRV